MVARKTDRAHRRMLRSRHIRDQMGNEPITREDGATLREPLGDEDPPDPSGDFDRFIGNITGNFRGT